MANDAYEDMIMLLNVNKNAKIVIESEFRANVRFLALMNASSRYWSSIHANECVFSRSEQQKVYSVGRSMFSCNHRQGRRAFLTQNCFSQEALPPNFSMGCEICESDLRNSLHEDLKEILSEEKLKEEQTSTENFSRP